MKATVSDISTVQKRVKVEVSQEKVGQAFNDVYERLRKKAHLRGFRPGKAPLNVIKQVYGGQAGGEVGEKLIQKYLPEALVAEKLNPVATPVVDRVDEVRADASFTFDAVVDIMPQIELPELADLSIQYREFSFDEGSVQKELQGLQRRQAKGKALAADTPAAKGHLAVISHHASKGGEPLQELDVHGLSVVIGQDELLPAVENMLVGMVAGQEKKQVIALPADYRDEDLAGQEIDFELKVDSLSDLILPELDDEFAKDVGFDSLAALREAIHKDLEKQTVQMSRNEKEGAALTAVLSRKPFEVPPSMVDQIIDSMISEIVPKADSKRWQEVITNPEVRQRFLPEAKRRAQNTLLLLTVIREQKIVVEDGEVEEEIRKLPGFEAQSPKEQGKTLKNLRDRVKESKMFEKAINWLMSQMKVQATPTPLNG